MIISEQTYLERWNEMFLMCAKDQHESMFQRLQQSNTQASPRPFDTYYTGLETDTAT